MEELQARHRKETRDLQSRITQKKKNATKRTRKGVSDECEVLERQLRERQQAELDGHIPELAEAKLADLTLNDRHETRNIVPEGLQESQVVAPSNDSINGIASVTDRKDTIQAKKPNRQKARLARRAAEQEAQVAAAEEEAANLPDQRARELEQMKVQMGKLGLVETFVRPDGHCLYSACALSMPPSMINGAGPDVRPYQKIRLVTGKFISEHPDDFAPFLEEPINTYVDKIQNTAEWGGQLELQAIARAFGVNIKVLQADGRIEDIGRHDTSQSSSDTVVWLAYYRHSFGLGEHYNSLKKEAGAT